MESLVFFDGVCNLCNGAVTFIIDRDRRARFRFASLQSEAARSILAEHGIALDEAASPNSLLLLEDGRLYQRSTAVLRIARHLGWPWSWAYAALLVPRPLRDFAYRFVARHRYRWFGKSETCRVPTPALRARFLG